MHIGIDIDGVVSDSYTAWLGELNRHYDRNITVLEDYEMHLVFDVPWDDMNHFFVENVERLFSIPNPVKSAREAILQLLKDGHEIIYITARTPEEENYTTAWMEKHDIPYDKILFTGFKSKVDLVKRHKVEIFIEDYMKNAKAISEAGIPVLLLDTTYNRGELPQGVIRCKDWSQILEEIEAQNARNNLND